MKTKVFVQYCLYRFLSSISQVGIFLPFLLCMKICVFCFNPVLWRTINKMFFFPERSFGLQKIHNEICRIKSFSAVRRGGDDQNNLLAYLDSSETVNDGSAV